MKIDFYVLENATSGQKSLLFACQLLEKAYSEQKRVYVHTNTREEADRLDAMLWTFRDDSFVPHNIYTDEPYPPAIQIGYGATPKADYDLLLNLAKDVPDFYQHFPAVIEIVFPDPVVQQLARARYKHYRDQGFEINTIKLKASEP